MSSDQPFYLTQNTGFGRAMPEDDFLQTEKNKAITDNTLTETQYFGFSMLHEQIQGAGYLWHHPNLHTVSGGLYVWRGDKRTATAAELCGWTNHMSDAALTNDIQNYRLENSYGIEVIEPLKRHRMTYSDPARKNSVDLLYEALIPPVMFGDGNHIEQPMRVSGELILRGKRYIVDCHCIRDRSWGKPRREDNIPLPPISWMTGVFNKDFMFCCNVFDQASQKHELTGSFVMADEKTLAAGWVYRDGKLNEIARARKNCAPRGRNARPAQDRSHHRPRVHRQVHRAFHERPARCHRRCHGQDVAVDPALQGGGRMPAALRRLGLYVGIPDRPRLCRRPHRQDRRRVDRDHEIHHRQEPV